MLQYRNGSKKHAMDATGFETTDSKTNSERKQRGSRFARKSRNCGSEHHDGDGRESRTYLCTMSRCLVSRTA